LPRSEAEFHAAVQRGRRRIPLAPVDHALDERSASGSGPTGEWQSPLAGNI
jgi:hypothetical protein